MTSLANALAAAVGSQSEKSNDAPAPFVFQTELSVGGGNLGTSAAAPVLQRPVATRELKDYPWLLVRLGLVSVVGKTMPNGRKCSIGTVILPRISDLVFPSFVSQRPSNLISIGAE